MNHIDRYVLHRLSSAVVDRVIAHCILDIYGAIQSVAVSDIRRRCRNNSTTFPTPFHNRPQPKNNMMMTGSEPEVSALFHENTKVAPFENGEDRGKKETM